MRKTLILFTIATLLFVFINETNACEPCELTLSLEETVQQADLIVIGRKYGEGPLSGPENQPDIYGPSWISIDVDHVLKGALVDERIKTSSWSGMCGYGILLDNKEPHIIFMKESGSMYDSVRWGCSVTKLPIVNEGVTHEGVRYTIDEFIQMFGLTPIVSDNVENVPAVRKDPSSKRADLWLRDVLAILIFVSMFVGLAISAMLLKHSNKRKKR